MPELQSEAMDQIYDLFEQIQDDDANAAKGTKAALRRTRVALSSIAKLCKEARKDILAKMKDK